MKKILAILMLLQICITENQLQAQSVSASSTISEEHPDSSFISRRKEHLNFFIVSKRKKGKFDLATRFNVLRSKVNGLLHPRKFMPIVAGNADQMRRKVISRLEKYQATIGTIWFDSHGMYKKGYSLFFIGHDEISRHTLPDSACRDAFTSLAPYINTETRIIIGSCYAGATYTRASIDYKDTTRMDGDSLMMTIGELLHNGTVYASESWVMGKPGLFRRKASAGGYPGRKLFRDVCYQPAWSHVGIWNQYSVSQNQLSRINTISLDPEGNLVVRGQTWVEEKKKEKSILMNLNKLKPGLYH